MYFEYEKDRAMKVTNIFQICVQCGFELTQQNLGVLAPLICANITDTFLCAKSLINSILK